MPNSEENNKKFMVYNNFCNENNNFFVEIKLETNEIRRN